MIKRCGVSGKNVSSLRAIIVDPSIVAFFPTKIVVHACSFIIYHILPDTLKVYTLIFPNATTINFRNLYNR